MGNIVASGKKPKPMRVAKAIMTGVATVPWPMNGIPLHVKMGLQQKLENMSPEEIENLKYELKEKQSNMSMLDDILKKFQGGQTPDPVKNAAPVAPVASSAPVASQAQDDEPDTVTKDEIVAEVTAAVSAKFSAEFDKIGGALQAMAAAYQESKQNDDKIATVLDGISKVIEAQSGEMASYSQKLAQVTTTVQQVQNHRPAPQDLSGGQQAQAKANEEVSEEEQKVRKLYGATVIGKVGKKLGYW